MNERVQTMIENYSLNVNGFDVSPFESIRMFYDRSDL
jgi:hypothetical protein